MGILGIRDGMGPDGLKLAWCDDGWVPRSMVRERMGSSESKIAGVFTRLQEMTCIRSLRLNMIRLTSIDPAPAYFLCSLTLDLNSVSWRRFD